jgi:hypothetical protein
MISLMWLSSMFVEIARCLREVCDVPIVFVTAHGDAETVTRIHEQVPDAPVLVKPVFRHILENAIAAATSIKPGGWMVLKRGPYRSCSNRGLGDPKMFSFLARVCGCGCNSPQHSARKIMPEAEVKKHRRLQCQGRRQRAPCNPLE